MSKPPEFQFSIRGRQLYPQDDRLAALVEQRDRELEAYLAALAALVTEPVVGP